MSYTRPGVSVTQTSSKSIASRIGAGDTLLIIGECDIYPGSTYEYFHLSGTSYVELSKEGIDDTSIVVTDTTNAVLTINVDYEVSQTTLDDGAVETNIRKKSTAVTDEVFQWTTSGGSIALVHQNLITPIVVTSSDGATTYTEGLDFWLDYVNGVVYHITTGTMAHLTSYKIDYVYCTIADAELLKVAYDFTPTDLYDIKEWQTLNEIKLFYGEAMAVDSVNSPISLAATFVGNALVGSNLPIIKTLAVNPDGDPAGDPATISATDWVASLNQIADEGISVIVLLTDNEEVWAEFSNFVTNQENSYKNRIIGFLGGGTNTNVAYRCTGSTSVFGLANKRIIFVGADQVLWNNPLTLNDILIPGYYAAAEMAGMLAALPMHMPLTRKRLASFKPFPQRYEFTLAQKNRMASSGVCVLESRRAESRLHCVHGKTTALTGPEDEEVSVVRTLDRMATELEWAFEEKFIGTGYLVDELTAIAIHSATKAFMQAKIQEQVITGYRNISVIASDFEPRQYDVYCEIRPAYPVNWIVFNLSVGPWSTV